MPDGRVHRGFLSRYTNIAQTGRYNSVLQDAAAPPSSTIIFTGHSLGGAVAMLAALNYKLRYVSKVTLCGSKVQSLIRAQS